MTRPAHCYACRRVTAHSKCGQLWRCPCGKMRAISVAHEERLHEGREAEFWAHVKQTPFCWPWVRPQKKSTKKRPQFFFQGQQRHIERVAFYFAFGRWPRYTLRTCGNPFCVKPDHLKDVSKAEIPKAMSRLGKYRFMKIPKRKICRNGLHRLTGYNRMKGTNQDFCRKCRQVVMARAMRKYRAKRKALGNPITKRTHAHQG